MSNQVTHVNDISLIAEINSMEKYCFKGISCQLDHAADNGTISEQQCCVDGGGGSWGTPMSNDCKRCSGKYNQERT